MKEENKQDNVLEFRRKEDKIACLISERDKLIKQRPHLASLQKQLTQDLEACGNSKDPEVQKRRLLIVTGYLLESLGKLKSELLKLQIELHKNSK